MSDLNVRITFIDHGSKAYWKAVELRHEILREPLGLEFTKNQLEAERDCIHIVAFLENRVVGALMLVAESKDSIKMRQVAVAQDLQSRGIGNKLVEAAENYARENGFNQIFCHARLTAISFYEQLNYEGVGEQFVEVTIPHVKLVKTLG